MAIYAGRPVRPGDLGPPALVERNQLVPLVYQPGGLAISTEGRALGRGGGGRRDPGDEPWLSRSTVTGPDRRRTARSIVGRQSMKETDDASSPADDPLPRRAAASLAEVGRAPDFSPLEGTDQHHAMYSDRPARGGRSAPSRRMRPRSGRPSRSSLLGDRRAAQRGDILTVVIEIDDSAEISNSTGRERERRARRWASPELFGHSAAARREPARRRDAWPSRRYRIRRRASRATGRSRRKEKLTLRVAATVVEELPNGVLRIEGQQEVRVNFEMRELIVTGYVRPDRHLAPERDHL